MDFTREDALRAQELRAEATKLRMQSAELFAQSLENGKPSQKQKQIEQQSRKLFAQANDIAPIPINPFDSQGHVLSVIQQYIDVYEEWCRKLTICSNPPSPYKTIDLFRYESETIIRLANKAIWSKMILQQPEPANEGNIIEYIGYMRKSLADECISSPPESYTSSMTKIVDDTKARARVEYIRELDMLLLRYHEQEPNHRAWVLLHTEPQEES